MEALRSGEYQQGKDRLRTDEFYCCLGVLCDISTRHGVGQWSERTPGYFESTQDPKAIGSSDALPMFVSKWAGLVPPEGVIDGDPEVTAYGEETTLANLNDSDHTFEEIADIIEAQL